MAYHIFKYDPLDPVYGLFTGGLTQAVQAYTAEHSAEMDPVGFTRRMFSRLMSADPDVALYVAGTDQGKIAGYALVNILPQDTTPLLFAWQFMADTKEVGLDILEALKGFAQERGLARINLVANGDGRRLRKRYQFTPYQTILTLPLEEPTDDSGD